MRKWIERDEAGLKQSPSDKQIRKGLDHIMGWKRGSGLLEGEDSRPRKQESAKSLVGASLSVRERGNQPSRREARRCGWRGGKGWVTLGTDVDSLRHTHNNNYPHILHMTWLVQSLLGLVLTVTLA